MFLVQTLFHLSSLLQILNKKELLEPILDALIDNDSRVRYFACESLYNVVKAWYSADGAFRNAIISFLIQENSPGL